jgi:chitin synthase
VGFVCSRYGMLGSTKNRFVIFLDLFSTIVQPAGVVYIGYLIYSGVMASTNTGITSEVFPLISIIMIVGIYGLQVIIFLLKRQWAMVSPSSSYFRLHGW